jgi:adenylyl cyclase-associated protein
LDSAIAALEKKLADATARLATVEKQIASGASAGPSGSSSAAASSSGGASSASVSEFEDLVNQYVVPFVSLSNQIGDKVVADQAALFQSAVQAQKDLLVIASQSKKPADDVLQKLIAPTSELMQKIGGLKDSNRASKFFNNLSTVAEGVQALGWVVVAPTPGPYVADMRGGSEFYSNRLLKEFKGNNQVQVDWVTNFNTFLKELQNFIKKNHTTGLTWNAKGGEASASSAKASSSAPSSGGAPPPPGPPPPPADLGQVKAGPDMSNVFSALSKGEGVTSGLKKVTDDMKSKNFTNKSSVVTAKQEKTVAPVSNKPAKLALEGNKWVVEYQHNNKSIVISDTEAKQTVYIYKCVGSVVQIKGKVNAVILDDCTKTAVVFETVVASFEVVNSKSVEVQVTNKVPSIAIDKTSGCQVYLGASSLDTEIVTSKSSEMNVLIPGATPDADLVEIAIPEQFKTHVKGNKLVTESVQHI